MTQDRLNLEYNILSRYFKPKQFRLTNDELLFAVQTNSLKVYTLRVDLTNDYPYNVPKAFITNPKPLRDKWGNPMIDASHSMHTLPAENGCTRICHYGSIDWGPNVSLYQIIIKIRIWLEMYENHLKTGAPLDRYLTSAEY
ncbi:MAG: hypothetical protein J6R15_05440 [Bacteroidales bacterium]|jgi:hypothetical protein|nr:hypothetical protein [Bacteroidales bacterium]